MTPFRIALICVFLPLISVHITWLTGTLAGNLTPCMVYWSECYSISATGRSYPEFFVFKALLIPTAVFMFFYWLLLHKWMLSISDYRLTPHLISGLGFTACLALIVYTVTLGAQGEPYALTRRLGVVLYFAFSSFAHLILLSKLRHLNLELLAIGTEFRWLKLICGCLVVSAIISALLGFLWLGWDAWENAYEWWFSLIMISQFYLVGLMWRKTRFTLTAQIG